MSCKHNSSFTDDLLLLKLYTDAVYYLRMYRKIILLPNISREITGNAGHGYPL